MTTTSTDKKIVHKNATDIVAHRLIERGISTRLGTTDRNDLITDDEKTISVRGLREHGRVPLMVGTAILNWDYVAIVTKVGYNIQKLYLIPKDEVEKIAINKPLRSDGTDNWYINTRDYTQYRDNYGVIAK
jgi:hypothetical protein